MPLFLGKPKKHAEPAKMKAKMPLFVAEVKTQRHVKLDTPETPVTEGQGEKPTLPQVQEEPVLKNQDVVRELNSLFDVTLDLKDLQ